MLIKVNLFNILGQNSDVSTKRGVIPLRLFKENIKHCVTLLFQDGK